MYSLTLTLDHLFPVLPAALVPPAARNRLRTAAAWLPAELSSRLFLECRLAEGDAPVDLTLVLEDAGRRILTGCNPAISLPPELAARPEWAAVRALCRRWSDPESPLGRGVGRVWLEFDLPGPADALPVPGVFVEFTRAAARRDGAAARWRLALEALEALRGGALPHALAASLWRCFHRLPAGASVPYVGVFPARGTGAVRLCVAGLGDARTAPYLAAVGWPGPSAPLAAELARARAARGGAAIPGAAMVDLDVGDGVLPGVGLEYVFTRPDQLRGVLRETLYLDALVARGLCAPHRRAGLLNWPGAAVDRLDHQLWPSLASRRVAHVKTVLHGGGVREAKAYLSVHHTPWLRRADRAPALVGRGTVPPRAPRHRAATTQLAGE